MTTTTWTGVTSLDWNTAANWDTLAVPTSADAVIFDSAAINSVELTADAFAASIDFTNYTQLYYGNFFYLTVSGNVTLAAGMSTSELLLVIDAASVITSNGQAIKEISDANSGANITLGSNLTVGVMALGTAGRTLAFGAFDITFSVVDGVAPYFDLSGGATVTYSAGAEVKFLPASGVVIDYYPPPGELMPPTDITGDDITAGVMIKLDPLVTESFFIHSGHINVNGQGITTTDILILSEDNGQSEITGLAGSTMIVGTDFGDDGVAIDGGTWNVTGTANASNTTVSNADFSGGTELDATNNVVNGGGNTNVNFGAGSSLLTTLNGLAIASVKNRNGLDVASVKSINGLANV